MSKNQRWTWDLTEFFVEKNWHGMLDDCIWKSADLNRFKMIGKNAGWHVEFVVIHISVNWLIFNGIQINLWFCFRWWAHLKFQYSQNNVPNLNHALNCHRAYLRKTVSEIWCPLLRKMIFYCVKTNWDADIETTKPNHSILWINETFWSVIVVMNLTEMILHFKACVK